jgi:organic hydroperoxide reductase OsmC/OhrA
MIGIGPNTTEICSQLLGMPIFRVTLEIAQDLIEKSTSVCPYSNATETWKDINSIK